MADIAGTAGNDTLTGGATADVIDGGAGNDNVRAGSGNDTVYGGAGSDTLLGEIGDDVIYGGTENDLLNGGAGNDRLYGEDGNDGIYGGGGDDGIWGGIGNDNLFGDGGNDAAYGGEGSDKINGGAGNDTLDGGAGSDILNGEAGNDVFVIRPGDTGDVINGGTGHDVVSLEISASDVTSGLVADIEAYQAWMAGLLAEAGGLSALALQSTGPSFQFASLGVSAGVIEELVVVVDGVAVPLETLTNHAPELAAEVVAATNEDTALAGSVAAVDADGDVLTWSVAAGPLHGTLSLDAATGLYSYTPEANYFGSDTFGVTVTDDLGASATQQVTVTVAPVNDAPVADAEVAYAILEDGSVGGQAAATDVDGDVLSWSVEAGPAHGTLSIDGATGAYTYLAGENYSGSDVFTLRVADGAGGFASQRVSVAIAAVADAPELSVADSLASSSMTLTGTAGNDTITGSYGDDVISGGNGNDVLRGDGASGWITALLNVSAALVDRDGSETLALLVSGVPLDAILSAGTRNADGSWSLTPADLNGLSITASNGAELDLTVWAASTEADGGSASVTDTIHVAIDRGTGSDTIDGGAGNDTLYGGAGNNRLLDGSGNDFVYAQAGNDTIVAGEGNDTYDGGAGFDVLDMSLAAGAVTANLMSGTAAGLGTDKILNFEGLIGSSYSDTLTGSKYDSWISAGDGNDKLYGNGGNDTLLGGAGNDTLDGGSGNDTFEDGPGNDSVSGGSGNDYILAGSGDDRYIGGSGFDTLDYSSAGAAINVDISKKSVVGWKNDFVDGVERIIGTGYDDYFKGSKAGNVLEGGAGNDTFRGLGGADAYTGGAGADTFVWYVKDIVSGGGTYLGGDTITDFSSEDRLDLREFTKSLKGAPVSDAVHVTEGAFGVVVSVKAGSKFQDLVTLQGVHGVTVDSLLADGLIIV
jgi:VCBS repeat-containing protein